MSYDLMVFESAVPPKGRAAFMEWFQTQTKWNEAHNYRDHAVTTEPLKAWFMDIIKQYPPMNGPLASNDVDDYMVTDYSIGQHIIYCSFSWDAAESANEMVRNLAMKHGVGFFDVSANQGEILFSNKTESIIKNISEDLNHNKEKSLKELTLELCQKIAEQEDGWEWLKSQKKFRKRIFSDTNLFIHPVLSFSGDKVLSQPRVRVENKYFSQIEKLCDMKPVGVWSYRMGYYFDDYHSTIKVFNEVKEGSHASWYSRHELPMIMSGIFERGVKIFNQEFKFNSERAFLISAIETNEERLYNLSHNRHMLQLKPHCQAILRLMMTGDKDFALSVLDRFSQHGGGHKTNMPKILPVMDEIIGMSPYYDAPT